MPAEPAARIRPSLRPSRASLSRFVDAERQQAAARSTNRLVVGRCLAAAPGIRWPHKT